MTVTWTLTERRYIAPMALTVTISKDDASKLMAQRISAILLGNPDIKRCTARFNALPDIVEARSLPLAEIAYQRLQPSIEKGSPALRRTLRDMAKDDSSLAKAFEKHLLSHVWRYPMHFYEQIKDETQPHGTRRSARAMANKLVKEVCQGLGNAMFVTDVQATAVTEFTPQARELAAQLAAKAAAKSAAR